MVSKKFSSFWYRLNEFSEIEELTQPLSLIYFRLRNLSFRSLPISNSYISKFGVLKSRAFLSTTTDDILVSSSLKVFSTIHEIFNFNSLDLKLKILFQIKLCFIF